MFLLTGIIPVIVAQTEERTSTVTFLAIDERGTALPGWKMIMFKSADKDHASQFDGLRATQIPVGSFPYAYKLTGPLVNRGPLVSPWTPSAGGKVWVERPEEFVVVKVSQDQLLGGAIDTIGPPFSFSIKGKLDGIPPQSDETEPVRINLHSPIPGPSDIDVLVSRTGEFQIFHALSGVWVLTVIRGGEILHVEPVRFDLRWRPTRRGPQPLSPSFVVRIESAVQPLLRVQ